MFQGVHCPCEDFCFGEFHCLVDDDDHSLATGEPEAPKTEVVQRNDLPEEGESFVIAADAQRDDFPELREKFVIAEHSVSAVREKSVLAAPRGVSHDFFVDENFEEDFNAVVQEEENFLVSNRFDAQAVRDFWMAGYEIQLAVIRRGPITGVTNHSAAFIGCIRDARKLMVRPVSNVIEQKAGAVSLLRARERIPDVRIHTSSSDNGIGERSCAEIGIGKSKLAKAAVTKASTTPQNTLTSLSSSLSSLRPSWSPIPPQHLVQCGA